MMKNNIVYKNYADLSFGQIHYRETGSGAPLLLLHQSPTSSNDYINLMNEWGNDFHIYAPDNPGNGMSDPLKIENPTIENYAKALIEFMDAVEIDKALVYGFHTGSCIATATSALFPDRFKHVFGNGISLLNEEELADILAHYSPRLERKEDGSHLAWLWERLKLQSRFFPWYSTREEDRLNLPEYSVERLDYLFREFMMAGNNYIASYNAAFAGDYLNKGYVPNDKVTFGFLKKDPVYKFYNRLPETQDKNAFDTLDELLEEAFRVLKSKI